jgi:hypothetical protein
MNEKELRDHLDELTSAIETLHAPDQDKTQLHTLIEQIEDQLPSPLGNEAAENLTGQVDGLVSRFEADHPAVAGILKNIMVTLSSMGV